MRASCLYLVFTTYQLRLAMAHRRAYGGGEDALLAVHRSVRLGDACPALFPHRLEFEAGPGVREPANRSAFANLSSALQALIRPGGPPPKLVIASAAYPVTNWLLVAFAGRVQTSILADGLSAYLPLRSRSHEVLLHVARRLYALARCGVSSTFFFRHPHGLDSAYVQEIFAEWPEFMPEHGKPVRRLPSAFEAPSAAALAGPRDTVWFLGQPHLGRSMRDLPGHLKRLAAALRALHPQARHLVYKRHHFESSALLPLLAELGFEAELRSDCAEELICASPPLGVYSYRSTALLSLRAVLPRDIPVMSVAPWAVQPPGERLTEGSIEDWLQRFGVDRPVPGSPMWSVEQALSGARRGWS